MAQKITTADCIKAISDTWPQIFDEDLPQEASKWKRISKRGKKGEPIERVFFHKSLPLQALVVETDGAITRATIRGFAPFDANEDLTTDAENEMVERADSHAGVDFLSKYPCYQPSDFLFRMCTEEEAQQEGSTWYELYPTSDFGRGECEYDGQVDYFISRYLPEGDGEACEGSFTSARSVTEATAELLRLGFIASSDFVPTSRSVGEDG